MSGTVTLDGKPLETGIIAFGSLQEDGVRSGAPLTNGKYAMAAARGLPPGTYRVRISAQEAVSDPTGDAPPPKELIPAEYNVNSDKTVTVSADGPNEFNFDIKTK